MLHLCLHPRVFTDLWCWWLHSTPVTLELATVCLCRCLPPYVYSGLTNAFPSSHVLNYPPFSDPLHVSKLVKQMHVGCFFSGEMFGMMYNFSHSLTTKFQQNLVMKQTRACVCSYTHTPPTSSFLYLIYMHSYIPAHTHTHTHTHTDVYHVQAHKRGVALGHKSD